MELGSSIYSLKEPKRYNCLRLSALLEDTLVGRSWKFLRVAVRSYMYIHMLGPRAWLQAVSTGTRGDPQSFVGSDEANMTDFVYKEHRL